MNQSKDTGKRLSYVHNIGNRQHYATQEMKKQVKKSTNLAYNKWYHSEKNIKNLLESCEESAISSLPALYKCLFRKCWSF